MVAPTATKTGMIWRQPMATLERTDLLANGRHPLTYCTNVHPAADLAAAEAVYRDRVAPVLEGVLGKGPWCLGAWWPRDVVASLGDEASLRRHGDLLAELQLVPSSLNLFPMGRFHAAAVKEAVYEPDWASDERLAYTLTAARAMAALLERAGARFGVMSTLPLGFRGGGRDRRPAAAHAHHVFLAAQALARLEAETGVHLVLALEPEPWCLLETASEAVTWLGDDLAAHAARAGDEASARHHVGLCLDLCHGAVAGEAPAAVLDLCERSGVRIGKVQLSAALVAHGPTDKAALLARAEPVWLHQTFLHGPGGVQARFLDLSSPELGDRPIAADERLVCHFHVPICLDQDGDLATTADQVRDFLKAVASGRLPEGTPLEVETYTRAAMLDRELRSVLAAL